MNSSQRTSSHTNRSSYGVSFQVMEAIQRGAKRVGLFLVPVFLVYLLEGIIVLFMWEVFRSAQGWIIQKTIFSQQEADLPDFLADSVVAPQFADLGITTLSAIAGIAFLVMLVVQLIILSQTFGMGVSLLSDNITLKRRLFLSRWALLEIIGAVLVQLAVFLRTAVWLFLGIAIILGGLIYFGLDVSTFLPLAFMVIAALLFLIRVLFVWFTQSFVAPIIVYEQRNFFSARTESKQFTDGDYHKIFMLWLVVLVLALVIFTLLELFMQSVGLAEVQGGALVIVLRYTVVHFVLIIGASFMGAAYKQANEVNLPNAPLALPGGK